MRIGISALGKISQDTGGKNYLEHFFRALDDVGTTHEIVLFLSSGESKKLELGERKHFRVVEIPNTSKTPLHKVIGEQIFLPQHAKAQQVDVLYYPGNFGSISSRIPFVVNIRGMAHYYPDYGVDWLRRSVRKFLMPLSARRAERIITPSEDIRKEVVRFLGVSPEKVQVISHGVDVQAFDGEANRANPISRVVLSRYGLESGKYLLYVSALWRYKNQDKLIEAHAALLKQGHDDIKLVIAGKGTGTDASYLQKLHRLPEKLGTAANVVFTGQLPQSDLKYLYAHAAAFIFPSSYESFGNPLFEAWASGVPVAASNVHSFPEMTAGAALLFDPKQPEELINSLKLILSDKAVREQLVEKGKERVSHFSWPKTVSETLRVIEAVRK